MCPAVVVRPDMARHGAEYAAGDLMSQAFIPPGHGQSGQEGIRACTRTKREDLLLSLINSDREILREREGERQGKKARQNQRHKQTETQRQGRTRKAGKKKTGQIIFTYIFDRQTDRQAEMQT